MRKDRRGICWQCPHWDDYSQYCDYYKMNFYTQGFEPTCNNPELIKED